MILLTVQFDDFETWRCLKPYPKLDQLIKKHPEGFMIKRKNRQPVMCVPGQLGGHGCQYFDYQIFGEFKDSTK